MTSFPFRVSPFGVFGSRPRPQLALNTRAWKKVGHEATKLSSGTYDPMGNAGRQESHGNHGALRGPGQMCWFPGASGGQRSICQPGASRDRGPGLLSTQRPPGRILPWFQTTGLGTRRTGSVTELSRLPGPSCLRPWSRLREPVKQAGVTGPPGVADRGGVRLRTPLGQGGSGEAPPTAAAAGSRAGKCSGAALGRAPCVPVELPVLAPHQPLQHLFLCPAPPMGLGGSPRIAHPASCSRAGAERLPSDAITSIVWFSVGVLGI